jgi:hypothetical protein
MVGNSENIFVDYDYNNIIVVDPNKIVDIDGKVKERHVKVEDLVMYANLECDILPRTKLAVGAGNNSDIQTISIAKVNFLKPGGKTFLDNSYTNEITGLNSLKGLGVNQPKVESIKNPSKNDDYFYRQSTYSEGKEQSVDNGLLGIVQIGINTDMSFMPVIDITLEDVKGKALFEGGDSSPYGCFFNLPYPLFNLTIKGYYGKALRLPLMLQSFTSDFNSLTGNFTIRLKFYTYKYTILTEISLAGLLAAPHMYKSTLRIEPKSEGPSQFKKVDNSVVERGYEKVKELYSEYKSKGLIPEDFPEITVPQLRNRLENFVKNITDSLTKENLDPLTNCESYVKNLQEYQKEVYYYQNGKSWFDKYMDVENFYVLKNSKIKIYPFKKQFQTEQQKQDALSELKELISKYGDDKKGLLNGNITLGQNGSYVINNKSPKSSQITVDIDLDTFVIDLKSNDVDLTETYIQRNGGKQPNSADTVNLQSQLDDTNNFNTGNIKTSEGNKIPQFTYYYFEGTKSFIEKTNNISKLAQSYKEEIQKELTFALSELLQDKSKGIGFVPNIRNVLAVIFASGEAFLRLLDDVHTKAWKLNNNTIRKNAILGDKPSSDNLNDGLGEDTPIYPWPQYIVATTSNDNREKYEIRYPGESDVVEQTQGYLYEYWPEIEFVEEFIRAYVEKVSQTDTDTETGFNQTEDVKRLTLNAIEFPIGTDVYSNKEEIKFLFEIFERLFYVSSYSKLNRINYDVSESDKITSLISDTEKINLLNSLSNDNPFLIQKLQNYGFNSSNFLSILEQFSNEGQGQSWQNFIRGIYNTSYIKNQTDNLLFEFINQEVLTDKKSQPIVSLTNENDIVNLISNSTKSNKFDLTDTYPFTNFNWVKSNLADGKSIQNVDLSFDTKKVLNFNTLNKVICNFSQTTFNAIGKPFSNFLMETINEPTGYETSLTDFYNSRVYQYQNVTEGDVLYGDYSGNVTSLQTTSMLNTPFFTNAIQEGVEKFRNYDTYPFVSAAYLFINSLPIATLREKYKTYENGATIDLDYIFATLKKFGAIHKVPYSWMVKIGSIWHRYKKYTETGFDIINSSWSSFDKVANYDPITNDPTKIYSLDINGSAVDIILEKNTVIGSETSTVINVGFYPKLINDFNVFYQGFNIIDFTYTEVDIQNAFASGLTLNYVDSAVINLAEGFDPNDDLRDLKITPWSVSVNTLDSNYEYPFPSEGSLINQTKNECFNSNGQITNEVLSNNSVYDGSVRNFWSLPHYGYFDISKIVKPSPEEYLKTIFTESSIQSNFSFNKNGYEYTKISEMFSIFEKQVLDRFEIEFLNFSKTVYDYESNLVSNSETETEFGFKNFQYMMRQMMKVPKQTGQTGAEVVKNILQKQFISVNDYLKQFLNYDVIFKFGNPSSFDKKLFYSFSNLPLVDKFDPDSYQTTTPNSLPVNGGNVTLLQSQINYPNEWISLKTYVGFSEIPELTYSDNGSYITDFFIDFNIAFTVNNIKLFAPIIKMYATQKLNGTQSNQIQSQIPPASFVTLTVASANLEGGYQILIKKGFENSEPNLWPLLFDENGIQVYEGIHNFYFPPSTWNDVCQQLINDTIIKVFGSLSTNPLAPQYIVTQQIDAFTNYPVTNNPNNKIGKEKFFEVMTNYLLVIENFLNKSLNNLLIRLRVDLPNITIQSQKINSRLQGPQTKVELWESFKATNDKWISGTDFKSKTLFEDVLILDRASRDIGSKVLVDVYELKNQLSDMNVKNNMLYLVNEILSHNHFVVMNVPAYMNFYNVQNATKNPIPKFEGTNDFANSLFGSFLNVDYRNSSTKMVCFYGGKLSEYLDIKSVDFRYKNDAFDLTKDNPLIENQIGKNDWDKSNRVVGFNVDIGTQNQTIFKGFSVSQNNGLSTAESLAILNEMANQAGNRGGATQNLSLYNLYKNRSYACSIDMLGNAMIQPTMYFNLRYVPMFSGPYMITGVRHTIVPGNFSTTVTGQRQPIYSLPQLDEYLQSIKTNLLEGILEKVKKSDVSESAPNTGINQNAQTSNIENSIQTTNVASNQVTQSCIDLLSSEYDYSPSDNPKSTSLSYEIMVNNITNSTSDVLLQKIIFATFYIQSGNFNNSGAFQKFNSWENNYGKITLNQYWGGSSSYFSDDKKFWCSSTSIPMASFSNVRKSVDFLVARWASRIVTTSDTPESISDFISLNWNKSNVSESISVSETNNSNLTINYVTIVTEALELFNSITNR